MKFDEILEINGKKLTSSYIESLNKQERLDLIDPIFNLLRTTNFIYMDDIKKIDKDWKTLLAYKPDLTTDEIFNNSSTATSICKYFCHSFYNATEIGKPTLIDIFNDDKKLKRIIENRLGLDWLDDDEKGKGVNESFNLSPKMILFQGPRSMRFVNATSMFKPIVAKYMAEKYSNEGDTIFDSSMGFGGRLLGTIASGRKYIGTDPMTADELEIMAQHLKLKDYILIKSGSENYCGEENSIDLSYTSPPYVKDNGDVLESYSNESTQAYIKGQDAFYNDFWIPTIKNIKYMLKPGKWFGLNVTDDCKKMVDIAQEEFGAPLEKIRLKTVRSHLTKSKGDIKYEPIYMFKNIK